MRKLIVTIAVGLLLTSAASVDAATAGKALPRLTEGRAAYVTPAVPMRFNDFGPDYGATIPFAGKAG